MVDLLDQSEIDALLNASDDDAPMEESAPEAAEELDNSIIFTRPNIDRKNVEVRTYDFKRPERVSKDEIRALQTLHEAFARGFGASVSSFLRTIMEVKVSSVEQFTFQEFIHALPNPTVFCLLNCKPLEGQMCLEISPQIVYPIIDRLLGGTAGYEFVPQRQITGIELSLITKIIDRFREGIADAWSNVVPLDFELDSTETNPHLVQIVPPNEVCVNITFDLRLGDKTGTMSLCTPFNVIEPVMEKLISQSWNVYGKGKRNDELRERVAHRLSHAPLQMNALLANTKITMNELLNLEVGDVIETEKPSNEPLFVMIEGKKKFLANIGQHENKYAVKVLRKVIEDDLL